MNQEKNYERILWTQSENIYLIDDNSEVKKSKGTKKCVRKLKTMFENYADCLEIKLY